jgi:hypothetical protein
MLTTELVKGTRVKLRNGWFATVADNMKRGATRMCTVEGTFTETGSVYATDIVAALIGTEWVPVEPTASQRKGIEARAALGW